MRGPWAARTTSLTIGIALTLIAGLVVGSVIAGQLDGALAIRFENKTLPAESPALADRREVRPLAALATVTLPGELATEPRVLLAERRIREATAKREQASGAVTVSLELTPGDVALRGSDEAYRIDRDRDRVVVRSATMIGATHGLFRIADRIAAGYDWADLAIGVVSPALAQRFVDTGAVGVRPDPEAYRAQDDYQHASGALADVVLADAPYVDPVGLARVRAEWRDYVDRVVADGYNGVVVSGFLEYVNFDRLGDGLQIYPADSPYRARHTTMKREVGAMWKYAHDMGLAVVFRSDMLALTGPLEAYLERETGLDPTHPHLWEVYRAGLDEFLGDFEWVDGFMIRIGEGGSIYHHRGWDYYSALKVTDTAGVRRMLDVATSVAAAHDATVYFRTWSVGVGEVGDMHTNPDTYSRLLGDFQRDNLVVSTKFVMGDFDSWLPLNPTLTTGTHRRLVELQGRREFEAFSSIPNDVGPLHQTALRNIRRANPRLEGVWMWTQDGGPWRAGPMSLYPKTGHWQLYDHNVYVAARLAWDPDADLGMVNGDWIRRTYTYDPEAVAGVGAVLAESRAAVLDGLYIRPYAERQVFALGLEPPPMMWIFKWDILSGDSAALSAVYVASRGRIEEAITAGDRAVDSAERMRAVLAEVPRDRFADPAAYDRLVASVDYEIDLLQTLQAYRVFILRYYEWLDTGSPQADRAWQAALPAYRAKAAAHHARWTGNLDLPPYNTEAAAVGLTHAERSPGVRLAAAVLLLLAALGLIAVPGLRRGALTPWRLRASAPDPRWERWAVPGLPLLLAVGSQLALSSAASPTYLLGSLGFLGLLAVTLRGLLARLRPSADAHSLWCCLGGAWLPGAMLLLGALAARGPGGYWFRFWTDPGIRAMYLTVAIALVWWWFGAVVTGVAAAYNIGPWRGSGMVVAALGVPLAVAGGVLTLVGLETGLTTLNNEMALLPLGLSRILGLTVHLGIPSALPLWLLAAGTGLALVGGLLAFAGHDRRKPVSPSAATG